MKKYFSERKLNILISIAAVATMWIVWIVVYYSVRNDYIIPSFQDTFASIWKDCLARTAFWRAFANTLRRTAMAFLISFALAAALAALGAISEKVSAFIKPFMVFLRTLPTLAIILILLIWTSPRVAPVIVTVLVLFPMIHAQFVAAIEGIDGGLREMAKVYGIGRKERIFKMYLPLISPNIFSQTGANISLGLKIMVSAEVLANTYRSLGGQMQEARLFLEMPRLAALTLIAVVAGLVFDVLFSQLKRLTRKWSAKEGGNAN